MTTYAEHHGNQQAQLLSQAQEIARLQLELQRLKDENKALRTDETFGVLTSQAGRLELERLPEPTNHSILYLDVDDVTGANARWGHRAVDAKMRAALQCREGEQVLLFRWYSGDELAAVVPRSQAQGFAERLQQSLQAQGMSATIVINPIGKEGATKTLNLAQDYCHAKKQTGLKASIHKLG